MIYIYGASGHGKVIAEIVELSEQKIGGFMDDNFPESSFNGYAVLGKLPANYHQGNQDVIIAIGNNSVRRKIAEKLSGMQFAKAIHPKASISNYATIGDGCVVMCNASINSYAKIGIHGIINTNASVDHDCEIGDYVHISPQVGLAGNVHIGEGTHVGIGASVIQGIKIGKWVTVGAGAVIISDVPDYAVVVGNPGRIIKYNKI